MQKPQVGQSAVFWRHKEKTRYQGPNLFHLITRLLSKALSDVILSETKCLWAESNYKRGGVGVMFITCSCVGKDVYLYSSLVGKNA